MMTRVSSWADQLARGVLFVLLAVMTVLVFLQVVLRYVFGHSIVWSEEVSRYAFVWASFMGASLASRWGIHVGVRILVDHLPKGAKRAIELTANIFILFFLCVAVYVGVQATFRAWNQSTAVLQIPMAIPYSAIPVGCFLMLIQEVESVSKLLRGTQAKPAEGQESPFSPVPKE
jgi:TRAP-type C4-dicarboxylate transport system permease small subunit